MNKEKTIELTLREIGKYLATEYRRKKAWENQPQKKKE